MNTDRLDAAVVLTSLIMIAAVWGGLMFVPIPKENLPILAGSLGVLTGTVIGGYAGFRWGASLSAKKPGEAP